MAKASERAYTNDEMLAAFLKAFEVLRPLPPDRVRAFADVLVTTRDFPREGGPVPGFPEVGRLANYVEFMAFFYVGIGIAYPERLDKLGMRYLDVYNAALRRYEAGKK